MTHVSANVINAGFRGYTDSVAGGITSQTAIAAANTNFSRNVGVKFHVAMRVSETAGGDANNYNYTLQYNRNGTGWNDVTTSTPIQSVAPTNCTTTNGASYGTTALSNGATIQATEYDTSGSSASNVTLNNASYEQTSCLRIDGAQVNNGDTIQLRLTNNGAALNADTTIPTVTAIESAATERDTLIAGASSVIAAATISKERAAVAAAVSTLKANWKTTTSGGVAFDNSPTVTGTMEVGQALTVNDEVTYQATPAIAAASTVAAVATVEAGGTTYERTAAISGSSTIAALSTQTRDRSVAVAAASTVAAISDQTRDRTVAVASVSTVAADATVSTNLERAVAIAGTSSLSATGEKPVPANYRSPAGVQADLVLDFNRGPYYAADTGSGLTTTTQSIISGFSALETVGGVTRLRTDNGDTPTVALSSFDFSATAGTVLCAGRFDDVQAFNRVWQIDGGSVTDRFGSYFSSAIQARAFMEESDIENALITKSAAYTSDTVMVLAISWGPSGMRVSFDGDAVLSDATITIPTGMTTLRLGHSSASDAPGGGIRRLIYWNTQISDADLVTMASSPDYLASGDFTDATAAIAAASVLSVGDGTLTRDRTAAVAASSALAAVPAQTHNRAAAVAATSTVTADATTAGNFERDAAIGGASTLGGMMTLTRYEEAVAAGTSSLTATYNWIYERAATVDGVSDVNARTEGELAATFAGTSRLQATWTTTTGGAVSFNADPDITGTFAVGEVLTVNDEVTYEASVTVAASSSVAATGSTATAYERAVAVAGASTVTAASDQTRGRSVAIAATSTATAASSQTRDRAVAIAGASTVAAVADVSGNFERTASIAAASALSATSAQTRERAATVSAASTVTAAASVSGSFERSASVAASAVVTAAGNVTAERAANINAASSVTAGASVSGSFERTAAIAATSGVATERERSVPRAVVVSASSTVAAVRVRSVARTVTVSGGSAVSVNREKIFNRAANVDGVSAVAATFTILGQSARRVEPPDSSENSGTLPATRGGTLGGSLRTGTVGRGS